MVLVDKNVRVFIANGLATENSPTNTQTAIYQGSSDCVTNIGYDLRANGFICGEELLSTYELKAGESVFVESFETIYFDNSTCGILSIKNSRVRQGLSVEAPVYQPGHKTRIYFRLTNLSDKNITLIEGEKYAFLMFEQLIEDPEKPYDGTFQNEFKYTGLAAYQPVYENQVKAVDKKIKDLQEIEKSIYGNVITIISIFIAIFSLINLNVNLAQSGSTAGHFLMYNFSLLGAVSFLAVLLDELLHRTEKRGHWLWIVPAVCFIGVLCINKFMF